MKGSCGNFSTTRNRNEKKTNLEDKCFQAMYIPMYVHSGSPKNTRQFVKNSPQAKSVPLDDFGMLLLLSHVTPRAHWSSQRVILNFTPRRTLAPRGAIGPKGWNWSSRGNVHPFVNPQKWNWSPRGNVHPFVHPQGWTLTTVWIMEGQTKIFAPAPGDNFTPMGWILSPGWQLRPWGQS
jgi:hypothetical protein